MSVILAIDAAWTEAAPSGVAALASSGECWRCLAVAPSYEAFIALANGNRVDWGNTHFHGNAPDVAGLLDATRILAEAEVDLVTIDMPVAMLPIAGRREADRQISRAFGARGCSTHSPNPSRPGELGAQLSRGFADAGYSVATATDRAGTTRRLVEAYPHPALLTLLQRSYRVPYKVGRAGRYWRGSSVAQRVWNLLDEFRGIKDALTCALGPIGLALPRSDEVRSLASLKPYEDAIDALISGWVGVCYFQGAVRAFGDATAAIWCPTEEEP